VINFGSGFEISIADTVSMIADEMRVTVEIETDAQRVRPAMSEVERLWADNSKARELLRWSPAYGGREGMRRGLAETVAWFSDPTNLAQYKSHRYNI
jgi:nucleoside-diphosphate-sugar epimerase